MCQRLSDIPRRAAEQFGSKSAIHFADRTLTFAELEEAVDEFANRLADYGIGKGAVVTLCADNAPEWIIAFYGIRRIGAIVNPVNSMLTPRELEYITADCGACAIVAKTTVHEKWCDSADSFLAGLMVFDAETLSLVDEGSNKRTAFNARKPAESIPEDTAVICYTSGTTGNPKGALLHDEAVALNAAMTAQMHMRLHTDRIVTALPCPHVYGTAVFNSALLCGATLILHARFDAGAFLQSIARHKATMIEGVPTMYFYLMDHPAFSTTDLSSLRLCTVGGQTMPVATHELFEHTAGCPLVELWGMTEIAGLGTTHPVLGPVCKGSVGTALPYMQTRIADLNNPEQILDPGEIGELQIRGPTVMSNYIGHNGIETFTSDGWLRTGDLAQMDGLARVYITGRSKDIIITGGFNIYPTEIEQILVEHPAVSMAAIGPIPDREKGELACAYIVLKDGCSIQSEDIEEFCRERLAAYKVPRRIVFADDLPKTGSGKIKRHELVDLI